eukprot:3102390-Amphidinium_carterae.1
MATTPGKIGDNSPTTTLSPKCQPRYDCRSRAFVTQPFLTKCCLTSLSNTCSQLPSARESYGKQKVRA